MQDIVEIKSAASSPRSREIRGLSVDKIKVVLRPYNDVMDRNFIISTWLKGQRFGNYHYSDVPQDIYFKEYGAVIECIMNIPGLEIKIACDELRPDWIGGFAVMKDDVLYWIYTRSDFRNRGIAKLLVSDRKIKTVQALTRIGRSIAISHGLIFNPFH